MTRTSRTASGLAALSLGVATVVLAPAAAQAQPDTDCMRAGIGTLKDLGLLQAAAAKQVDYSTLANPTTGPIFTTLPAGSNLSLGAVVKLHHTNPELFAWCR